MARVDELSADELSVSLIRALLPAGRSWQKAADSALAGLGIPFTLAQHLVALANEGGGINQTVLALATGVEAASTTRCIDLLEARRLLIRQPTKHDRRVKLLLLTEEGKTLAREAERALLLLRRQLFAHLSVADRKTCLRFLEALRRRD